MGMDVDDYLRRLRRAPPPPMTRAALPEIRARFAGTLAAGYPQRPISAVRDALATAGDGSVPVRIYEPGAGPGPAILYFHGGGFVLGSIGTHDGLCRDLAARTGWTVVSVDYRLAPEAPYPAALDDALTAFDWLAAGNDEVDADPTRLVVMGDSAGGYLAAQLALRRRPALQVLLYPALDLTASRPSHVEFGEGFGLDSAAIGFCYECFVPPARRPEGEVSPLLAASLSNASPALIVAGSHDPLRDEAMDYARRLALEAQGVSLRIVHRMLHGFLTAPTVFDEAGEVLGLITDELCARLANPHARHAGRYPAQQA